MQWNKAQSCMKARWIDSFMLKRFDFFFLLVECLIYTMCMRLNLLFPTESTNRGFSFSAQAKYPSRYATGLARSVAWYKTHLWNRKGDVSSVLKECKLCCFNYAYVIRDVSRTRHRHVWCQVNLEMINSFQQESLLPHFSKNDPTGYKVILLFIAVS